MTAPSYGCGCLSQGHTLEEAASGVHDAMAGWISVALGDGMDIPEPTHGQDFSGRLLLRMPTSLHARLVTLAEAEGVSLNTFVTNALSGAVGWRSAEPV